MISSKLLSSVLGLYVATSTAAPLTSRAPSFKQVPSVPLTRAGSVSDLSSYALRYDAPEGVAALIAVGPAFYAEISFGSHSFLGIVDTGSSDTWTPVTGFECVDPTTGAPVSEDQCGFATTYTPGSEFTQIQDQNFFVSYGSGEAVLGVVGTVPVTFAGVQIPSQEVGLVTEAGFSGDGVGSGLIGLAYPGITNAYPGTDPSVDDPCSVGEADCNEITYSSLTNTIFNVDKLTDPLFALALSRDESGSQNGGTLTLGGIPDVSDPAVNASDTFATTAITVFPMDNRFRFYLIDVDGFVGNGGSSYGGDGQYVVDSGTTLNYFPPDLADAVNAAFDPPATLDTASGLYLVDCGATPPELGTTIGGQTFPTNPVDLIIDGGNGVCASGVQSSGTSGISILGDVFLNNVLAVFDVGTDQMAFASREYYES